MLILLLLMALVLAAGCWAYSLRVARTEPPRHCRREGGRPDGYARPVRHGGVGGVHGPDCHEYLGDRNPCTLC